MDYTRTYEKFRRKIKAIAGLSTNTEEGIYAMWCKYEDNCRNYDQSPLLWEFCSWYADRLGCSVEDLRKAVAI